jgi:hypothetical protein
MSTKKRSIYKQLFTEYSKGYLLCKLCTVENPRRLVKKTKDGSTAQSVLSVGHFDCGLLKNEANSYK